MKYSKYSDERLMIAWVRANMWKWDKIFGEKPYNFDNLPNTCEHGGCKLNHIAIVMREIEEEFASRATSKAWWLYYLNKTEAEWKQWYFSTEHNI